MAIEMAAVMKETRLRLSPHGSQQQWSLVLHSLIVQRAPWHWGPFWRESKDEGERACSFKRLSMSVVLSCK